MKKAVTPVIAMTLIILTLIVVLGVLNFWFLQIKNEEIHKETFTLELNCDEQIVIDNYGFPNSLGPVVVSSDGEEYATNKSVRYVIINCK